MSAPTGKFEYRASDVNPNRAWWQNHPMTYDWEGTLAFKRFSSEWYNEIDRRFFESAYYAQSGGAPPFARFMPESEIHGKRILEIGCGAGTHAELLTRRGATLTAIDQTVFAVEATTRRLTMKDLPCDVRQMDAEVMDLPDCEFDMVWTWGVIHHSRSTENILQNISRVLKPGGSLRLMVYYRPSLVYWAHCGFIRGILMGHLLHKKLDQIYVDYTDGFFARTFNKPELTSLLRAHGFALPRFTVVGVKAELYPIPRTSFKVALEKLTPDWLACSILAHGGSMIYAEAVRGR
jgi:SAM-dependent methyltransferase